VNRVGLGGNPRQNIIRESRFPDKDVTGDAGI
jgi:hypothetical protein